MGAVRRMLGRWRPAPPVARDPDAARQRREALVEAALALAAIRERLRPFRGTVRVTPGPDARAVIAVEVPVVN